MSLLISSKLHFLSDCENNEKMSSVQVMTIKIDVSFFFFDIRPHLFNKIYNINNNIVKGVFVQFAKNLYLNVHILVYIIIYLTIKYIFNYTLN